MYPIMEFLFSNIILLIIVGFGIYVYVSYKKLNEKKQYMTKQFDKYLNNYLHTKINLANEIANKILNEYENLRVYTTQSNEIFYLRREN
jgi:hypothetical protein